MIGSTSKTIDEVNALIQKYMHVLELIKKQEDVPYLAVVFDTGINYVKTNFNNIHIDWKAWSIVCLKHLYLNGYINSEEDISKQINNFFNYTEKEYNNYANNTTTLNDFDRTYGFVLKYISNQKGSV